MKKFDRRIIHFKDLLDSRMKEIYKEGPKSLVDPIDYVLSGIGKRFRPILTMIVADINSIPIEDILYPSISVEMLHNFTLIHDDIMDKDTIRHGKETVHEKWNDNTAILSGDAMLAISMQMLMKNNLNDKTNLVKIYIDGLLSVCEGQALDIEFENRLDVTIDEYKKMIYLKTAYMIGLSSQIGAILSGLSKREILLLKSFGESIGMAYQVQDDLLELFSDSDSMNKSLDSDFTLNKKTFLWTSTPSNQREELQSLIEEFSKEKDKTILKLKKFVINNGVEEQARAFISKRIKHANNILDELNMDTEFLYYYSNLIFNRGN